ncbi:MAG: hypothetical protein R2828_35510 [Saprospiraceae bacterium]
MSRALLLTIGLLASISTQAQDTCQHQTYPQVNSLLIQQFQAARCLETVSWQVDSTQVDSVNIALGKSRYAQTRVPFLLLFSTSPDWEQEQPLFLISKGHFKAHRLSIPLDWPGYYFFAVLDHQQPALITVDNSDSIPLIMYRQSYALHY